MYTDLTQYLITLKIIYIDAYIHICCKYIEYSTRTKLYL